MRPSAQRLQGGLRSSARPLLPLKGLAMFGGIKDYLSVFSKKVLACRAPFFPSSRELALASWVKNQGDKTYRLDYDLSEESVVLDLGGFEGQWTSDIFAMYLPHIFVFEPVASFFEKIKRRFRNNSKVTVYPFGLAKEDSQATIYLDNDGSSMFPGSGRPPVAVKMVRAATFIEDDRIEKIDLM